jgi:hypothetical protein
MNVKTGPLIQSILIVTTKKPYQLLVLLLAILLSATVSAQGIKGRVVNLQEEPVPYATIQVKGIPSGVLANSEGVYELSLPSGKYKLRVSAVGYKTKEVPFFIPDTVELKVVLEEDHAAMDEVVIVQKVKDRANEVMRTLVKKKDSIAAAPGAYSYQLYTKAVMERSGKNNDYQMSMAEVISKIDYAGNGKIKEQREAVLGNTGVTGLFFPAVTEENFSLYNDLVKLPALSPTPFLSPVSKAGLMAYKFKTLKVSRTGKHRIYTISVKPLQVTNATVEGELVISDSAWAILHATYRLPSYHLQEFDFFEVQQEYAFFNEAAWMLSKQEFFYNKKAGKQTYRGQTSLNYTSYELNKNFSGKHFGNEVSSVTAQAYDRDTAYWSSVRTIPLNDREEKYLIREADIKRHNSSDSYLDSLDRAVSKITWPKILFFGQSLQSHRKEQTWHFSSVAHAYQPIAFGGSRIRAFAFVEKTYISRKQIRVNTELSYGLRNSDLNGVIEFYKRYNAYNFANYIITAGREFTAINEGDAYVNMIKKSNIYLNNYIYAGTGRELFNGLMVDAGLTLALRRSVAGYKTGHLVDSLLAGDILGDNQAVAFDPYNAMYGRLYLQYTPAQRYRREPREKVILGSNWPSFYVQWEKGIKGPFDSEIDFDYVEFGLKQTLNIGLLGQSRYTIRTGDFLNKKGLRFIDHKFQRQGDPLLFLDPHRSFQALDSSFSLFHRYYEAHLYHQFNGVFINKIPLLKKLQLREVAGAGFLIAPERKLRYGELFAGVERAFQSPLNALDRFKLGIYVVTSASNQFKNPVQFKIGFTTWDKRRNRWR